MQADHQDGAWDVSESHITKSEKIELELEEQRADRRAESISENRQAFPLWSADSGCSRS